MRFQQRVPAFVRRLPDAVEGVDGLVLFAKPCNKGDLSRLVGGRRQRAQRQRRIVAPGHLVVDEVPDAVRVVDRLFHAGQRTAERVGEFGVERVGELAPVPSGTLDLSCPGVKRGDVRRLA